MTETRSAAFPACSDGFDDVDGGPECGVYIQMRGVEQVCIRRRFQRGYRPRAVALVTASDVGQDLTLVDAASGLLELGGAAARAHLRAGGDEDLHVRVRKDHGSDVATIEHRAGGRAPEVALEGAADGLALSQVLKQAGLTASTSEAMRMIDQGGVKLNGDRVTDKALRLSRGDRVVVQVGKRKFARVEIR